MASSNIKEDVKPRRRSLFGDNVTFAEVEVTYPQEYLDKVIAETHQWKTHTYKILRKQEKLTKKLQEKEVICNQMVLTHEQLYFLGFVNLKDFFKQTRRFFQGTNFLIDLNNQTLQWMEEVINTH